MVEPFGVVAGVLGSCDVILRATKTIAEYVSDVKRAPKDFDQISSEIQNLQAITAALQAFLDSERVKKQGFERSAPIANAVEKCTAYVSDLERNFDAKRKKSRFLWPVSGKVAVQKILQELNRYTSLFHWALSVNGWSFFCKTSEENTKHLEDSLKSLQKVVKVLEPLPEMQEDIMEIKDHLELMQSMLLVLADDAYKKSKPDMLKVLEKVNEIDDHLQSQTDAVRKKELLEWISSDTFLQKHRDVALARQKGTSTWVLESKEYKEWFLDQSVGTLWCHGIPGSGKTVIFSAMVDQLLSAEKYPSSIVGVVYFDYKEAAKYDVFTILSGILRQFCEKTYSFPEVRKTLTELKELSTQQKRTKLDLEECEDLLERISAMYTTTYLCFDALDELPNPCRYNLMKSLLDLYHHSHIKLLLTSRDNISLNPRTEGVVERSIIATNSDLQTYLEAMIASAESSCLYEKAGKNSALREQIIGTISSKAKGMFLLAELQIKQLEGAITERQIKHMLDTLPETIEDQYKSYIERIGGRQQGLLALRALIWVYGSFRPFSPEEFLEALSIYDGDIDLDPTGIPTMETVMNISGGLLTFEKESNTVRLVHETLQEYFDRHHEEILPDCHLMMSRSLATYLNFESFNVSRDKFSSHDWMTLGALRRSHKLLSYTFLNWEHHVRKGGHQAYLIGLDVVKRISSNSVFLSFITDAGLLRLPFLRAEGFLPLHVAVLWKSEIITREYLGLLSDHDRRWSIAHRSEVGLTAIHLAAINNHVRIAEMLIEHGANISAMDQNNRTLLHFAAACSSNNILRLILSCYGSKKREVTDKADMDGLTSLHAALQSGNVDGAVELLSAGAEIEATTASGQTALHYAAQYAPSAATILLERGASIEAVSKNGRNALQWACVGADHDCIRLLLDHGAQPNAQLQDGESVLHLLAKASVELLDICISLVEMGAHFDKLDKEGSTPLHNAIKAKNFAIGALLVSQGARIYLRNRDGKTPLHLAAAHQDVPKSLWTLLGDVNMQNEHGEASLHLAAKLQSATELGNLIGYGADVNIRNEAGVTPLHLAVQHYSAHRRSSHRRAMSDPVSLLLENGADVDALTKTGESATRIALEKCSLPLLKMLFSRDASIHWRFPDGTSPLHFAISKGSLSLLEILLQHGADVNEACCDTLPLRFAVDCLVQEWNASAPLREKSQSIYPQESLEHDIGRYIARAASGKLIQSIEKISVLIAYGADPHTAETRGGTPFDAFHLWCLGLGFEADEQDPLPVEVAIAAAISAMRDPKSSIEARLKSTTLNADEVEWNDDVPIDALLSKNKNIELRPRRITQIAFREPRLHNFDDYPQSQSGSHARRQTDNPKPRPWVGHNQEPSHDSPSPKRDGKRVRFAVNSSEVLAPDSAPRMTEEIPFLEEHGFKNQGNSSDASDSSQDRLRSRKQQDEKESSRRVQKHPARFQCHLCPKRFTSYNLRSHLRTHTDERPFICAVCGEAFARADEQKRHELVHSSSETMK